VNPHRRCRRQSIARWPPGPVRYERDKRIFAEDVTARYLSERIEAAEPAAATAGDRRGSFAWVASQLQLQPVERFVLAVALLPVVDSAAGQVIASCLNDPSRTAPTLALAQRLWDEPDELAVCFDPTHALLRHGLLSIGFDSASHDWQSPLTVPRSSHLNSCSAATRRPRSNPPAPPVSLDRRQRSPVGRGGPPRHERRIVPVSARGAPLAEVAAAAPTALASARRPSAALPPAPGAALTAAWLWNASTCQPHHCGGAGCAKRRPCRVFHSRCSPTIAAAAASIWRCRPSSCRR
jgi:hypothetical protein